MTRIDEIMEVVWDILKNHKEEINSTELTKLVKEELGNKKAVTKQEINKVMKLIIEGKYILFGEKRIRQIPIKNKDNEYNYIPYNIKETEEGVLK